MQLNKAMRLEGRFKIEISNTETGEKRELDWQENKILTKFLSSAVPKVNTSFFYLHFGFGTSTPSVTDTTLTSPLSAALNCPQYFMNTQVKGERVGALHKRTFTYKFLGTQGLIQGNITEIGMSTSGSMTSLFTRALIKDTNGNPTTLSLGPNDILTVYYSITNIIDTSVDIISSKQFTFNGQTITATLRLINQDAPNTTPSDVASNSMLTVASYNSAQGTPVNFILPYVHYITVANGSIANYRNISVGTLTSVAHNSVLTSTVDVNGVGIAVKAPSTLEYAAGNATGTWKYLFFSSATSSIAQPSGQAAMNICNLMIELNPPLVKAAADKFTFNTLEILAGGVPV